LIIRTAVGLVVAAHGAQKLFGWFTSGGTAGTTKFFESIGFRPGRLMAVMAGLGEFAGGIGLAVGVLTPFAAAAVIATMIVAIFSVHISKGLFASNGGYEYPLTIIAVATGLSIAGPSTLSIDHAFGLSLVGPRWGAIAIVLAVLGALPPLLARVTADQATAR